MTTINGDVTDADQLARALGGLTYGTPQFLTIVSSALLALPGMVAATFDTRFSPKLPLTGTWVGGNFTFTWNANGTINTSSVVTPLGTFNKTAVYDTDGTLLSYA